MIIAGSVNSQLVQNRKSLSCGVIHAVSRSEHTTATNSDTRWIIGSSVILTILILLTVVCCIIQYHEIFFKNDHNSNLIIKVLDDQMH